jgi:hypothetical protein
MFRRSVARRAYSVIVTSLLHLLRLTGLTARVTRLIVSDTITAPAREHVIKLLTYDKNQRAAIRKHERDRAAAITEGTPPDALPKLRLPAPTSAAAAAVRTRIAELITCRWCAGVWVAAAVVLSARLAGHRRAWQHVADAATAAYLTGFVAGHE